MLQKDMCITLIVTCHFLKIYIIQGVIVLGIKTTTENTIVITFFFKEPIGTHFI